MQTQQPPKTIALDDGHGIQQAMRAGDAERLDAIRKEPLPPPLQDFANAAYFRTLFHLKTSSGYAQKCYDYGMQPSVLEKNPVIAAACGQLLAGNFIIEGDVANWAKIDVEIKQAVVPVFQKLMGRSDVIPDGFAGVPAEPFTGAVAANRVFLSSDVNVSRVDPGSMRGVTALESKHSSIANAYLVTVKINGVDRTIALDTGSSITMLRPSTAHALGIQANPSPLMHFAGDGTLLMRPEKDTAGLEDARLAVVHQMRIGAGGNAILLEDVPVGIGGNFDVLGMNILSRMNSLYITSTHVVMNAKRPPIACDAPLTIASELAGGYIPVLRYTVDGGAQLVAFDSGSMSYLTGTALAPTTNRTGPDVAERRGDIAGVYEGSYVPVRATFGTGPSTHTEDIKVFPSYKAAYRYVLGVKALMDFNVFFDFGHGKACLEPLGH
ncbi:retropepsin-like aspartic protease [Rhodanobacter sp. DHG33]|uniref:retropepsin-like aspartic protease n=1 Tax=Rhodanobacter sp. DHG33 TaxID=2775921 RepID=UPI00177EFBC6|nr:retropepsin-like aspartic protease [Rhodanobacter sp. DHG33]MBD8900197.1 retroviral-like aspartic protease family protein [Rhodanobacter sp. DHG33]